MTSPTSPLGVDPMATSADIVLNAAFIYPFYLLDRHMITNKYTTRHFSVRGRMGARGREGGGEGE